MGTAGVVVLGVVIGLISGLVGIGGGGLLIPAFVYFYGMSQHKAQGTSIASLLLPVGIFACWKYHKAGNVDVRIAVLVAVGFAVGGLLGGTWAQHLSDLTLKRGCAVLLIVIGARMLWS